MGMDAIFPLGVRIGLGLNELGDPMISVDMVLNEDGDAVSYVFTEQGIVGALASIQEGLVRAMVVREMITMFPEQTDQILATVHFHWTGMIDGS